MKLMMGVFGASNRGKTETLVLLIHLFERCGRYNAIYGPKPADDWSNDLIAVFERDGFRIGISTQGDDGPQVEKSIKDLAEKGCDMIVTATRTKNSTTDAFAKIAEAYNYQETWFEKNSNNDWCDTWPDKPEGFEAIKRNHINQNNMVDASFLFGYFDSIADKNIPDGPQA